MKRVFLEIKFNGSAYSGWQIQPNALTVQECIETSISKIYNQKITILGCGRTDAGVHASQFYLHVDIPEELFDNNLLAHKLNGLLPKDISVVNILNVSNESHARFDATYRAYRYHLHFHKDPFLNGTSFRYNQSQRPVFEDLNKVAEIIKAYSDFYPFCKTKNDLDHYRCEIYEALWTQNSNNQYSFYISANRFLRGMVRLIVGTCIKVSIGAISVDELRVALDNQSRLKKAWAVPPEGLFLVSVKYPYIHSDV